MGTCFVIQGFGKKTDFTTSREFDLDASYGVIKEAVEEAGLKCIRADEILHSGMIDLPMYEQLLEADLVIADLSTYNVNAVLELGVRYALRPRTTIVVAESNFKYPFDLSHIAIQSYQHKGKKISKQEKERFKERLKTLISTIITNDAKDSPIYTLIPELNPPERPSQRTSTVATTSAVTLSAKQLQDQAKSHMDSEQFIEAASSWKQLKDLRPHDDYVIQQHALATYKSKQPSAKKALVYAKEILETLNPETSNDPETLGLWGAIHKRLWEIDQDQQQLQISMRAYNRGFVLNNDYYNGINLAFLLDQCALLALEAGHKEEAQLDRGLARRTRQAVLAQAKTLLEEAEEIEIDKDARYWMTATLWEAAFGLGDSAQAQEWENRAKALNPPDWMLDSTQAQFAKLQAINLRFAELNHV